MYKKNANAAKWTEKIQKLTAIKNASPRWITNFAPLQQWRDAQKKTPKLKSNENMQISYQHTPRFMLYVTKNFQVKAWHGMRELAEHQWECHHIQENRSTCDIHFEITKEIKMGW